MVFFIVLSLNVLMKEQCDIFLSKNMYEFSFIQITFSVFQENYFST